MRTINQTSYKVGHKGMKESENPNWKGDKAGYGAIHDWLKLYFGKPKFCEHCGTKTAKKYEWANISKKYKRSRQDWLRLCTSCHHKYDGSRKKMWETRRNKAGKICLECNVITTSKYQLCRIHLKKMFNKKRSKNA